MFLFDYSIQQTLDGGYIVLTTRDTTGGLGNYGQDVYLLKLDSRGNEQWNKIYLDQMDKMKEVVQFNKPMITDLYLLEEKTQVYC